MFFKSFFKVGLITFFSRVLGLVRDTTTAIFLGTSASSDAFVIAFKLPNVFRRLFAEGSLNSVFIPIFSSHYHNNQQAEARRFANEVFTIVTLALVILIVLMEIFMPWVLLVIAPGFNTHHPEEYDLAVTLTRISLPYLLFISLASIYASILNSFKRFGVVAALPFVLNISIIAFLWVSRVWDSGIDAVYFGTTAITTAGIIQCILMFLCVYRLNWNLIFVKLSGISQATKNFFKRVVPIIITAGIYQINIFIDLTLASYLGGGAITYLYYGDRLNQLPLAIIGIATSTVIVPFLVSKKDNAENHHIKANAILYGMLLGLPAVLAFCLMGKEIITMLFNYGKFDNVSVQYTYYVLCFYALGLIPNILIKIIVAIFYAESQGKIPFYVNLFLLIFNTILSIVLSTIIGVVGISLATSLSSLIGVGILMYVVCKKGFVRLNYSFVQELIKGTLLTCVLFVVVGVLKWWFLGDLLEQASRKAYILIVVTFIMLIIIVWLASLKFIKSKLYNEILSLINGRTT